jgi:hypothetical protein
MNSTVPVRLFSKTVCLVTFLLAIDASAGIDSPGRVSFDFLAEPDVVYQHFDQVPEYAPRSYVNTRAYFSTDASFFDDTGVRIWVGFDLEGPDGGRHAMLILDLNLRDPVSVRAEYLETRNDQILFEGYLVAAEARIIHAWLDDGDAGSVEGEFECIFMDPSDPTEGSRVLLAGQFFTETRPQRQTPNPDPYYEDDTYVETGCESEVYVEDDYEDSGCEGDTYDSDYEDTGCGGSDDDYDYGGSSDCEGDTYDSGSDSGCEGDTYDSGSDSGCEGDTYDSSYSDSSSCEGDSYDSYDSDYDSADCEGDEAYAATLRPAPRRKRRPNPLRAIMRMFPEIIGISFIVYMKRRFRTGRL